MHVEQRGAPFGGGLDGAPHVELLPGSRAVGHVFGDAHSVALGARARVEARHRRETAKRVVHEERAGALPE
ncbi:MAG: hypothetical protein ACK56I_09335, partial [bacterium]